MAWLMHLVAWLTPRLCVHVPCMYTSFHGLAFAPCLHMQPRLYAFNLARSLAMYACAVFVYLLSWLGSHLAYFVCAVHVYQYLLPRVCLLSSSLADASLTLRNASHVLARL